MFITNSIKLFDRKYAEALAAGKNPRWMSCGGVYIVCTTEELNRELERRGIKPQHP